MSRLVVEHEWLIWHILKKYKLSCNDVDDWYGILAVALMIADKSYKPSMNISFSTYAYKCMVNELNHVFVYNGAEKRGKKEQLLSLDYDYSNNPLDMDGSIKDNVKAKINVEEEAVINSIVDNVADKISDTNCLILSLLMKGYSCEKIGREIGRSGENVRFRISKTIKPEFIKEGIGV